MTPFSSKVASSCTAQPASWSWKRRERFWASVPKTSRVLCADMRPQPRSFWVWCRHTVSPSFGALFLCGSPVSIAWSLCFLLIRTSAPFVGLPLLPFHVLPLIHFAIPSLCTIAAFSLYYWSWVSDTLADCFLCTQCHAHRNRPLWIYGSSYSLVSAF